MSNRREFIVQLSLAGTVLAAGTAQAQGAMVKETDAQAMALGYKTNSAEADKAKYPKHTADQKCANCSLYQGKAAAMGGCGIFPGKQVVSTGWCSAYAKKA
jgi:hypothetical protein